MFSTYDELQTLVPTLFTISLSLDISFQIWSYDDDALKLLTTLFDNYLFLVIIATSEAYTLLLAILAGNTTPRGRSSSDNGIAS